jgi:ketosteroid isomerase-like protein
MPEFEAHAVRRIYDAFSRWDVDELAREVTHDFELILPKTVPWGGTRHGRDGLEAWSGSPELPVIRRPEEQHERARAARTALVEPLEVLGLGVLGPVDDA